MVSVFQVQSNFTLLDTIRIRIYKCECEIWMWYLNPKLTGNHDIGLPTTVGQWVVI